MIVPSKFNGYNKDGTRNLFMGGGGSGGGAPTQTTSTVQNTNIPSYAQPYVESMLGATQKQLFNTSQTQTGTDDQGNPIMGTSLDSFKPYQAYGGTYDAQGNQLSYDPGKAVAGFSPMQQAAQQGIGNMGFDPGRYNMAQLGAEAAGRGGLSSAQTALNYGAQGAASGLKGQELGIAGGQKYGDMGAAYGTQGANLGIAGGAQYGAQGAGYGSQAAGLADTALGYGNLSSQIGQMGLQAQQTGQGITDLSKGYAAQQAGAGQQYAQMATDPRITKALMNPYTQNVLDVQNKELDRSAGVAAQNRGAAAVRAGAFGGGRQAIENAEADRNLAMMKNANEAQALNQAYQQAQAQQQFGANLNLQGLSGAQQGLGTALQGGQLGLSGIGTALQGQQGALAGVGAANQAYQTGIQGANTGLQGVNTQLAGTAQGMQGAQVGLQGVDRQLAGTAQGMQGAQVGLQGVQGAQAGYGLTNQSAANMTSMLGQEQANQLGLYGAQNAAGAQQQALEQAKINQSMLDYANAQQYPLMQLGTMSNMLRGLPMQASTTNQYAASPNPLSQAIGTVGAGASIYNAMKPGGAAGGLPSEFKYAKGGITSVPRYDVGGDVQSTLEGMDDAELARQAKESASPAIRRMAERLLREHQMSKQPQSADAAGVQYQAAQPQMPSYKPGGIVAFTTGGGANEEGGEQAAKDTDLAGRTMADRLAMPPSSAPSGIMAAAPVTQVAPETPPINVQPGGVVTPAMAQMQNRLLAQQAAAQKSSDRPLAELVAEKEALLGPNTGREDMRAQEQARRANMGDEQERQMNLRKAEFFARWGSTPGPVLVAGMNALKESIPGIISDEKEAKKLQRESDKIIYDLDQATRLEKQGNIKESISEKNDLAKRAEDLNKTIAQIQERQMTAEANITGAQLHKEGTIQSALIRAQQDKLNRGQAEAHKEEDRKFNSYLTANSQFQHVKESVAKQESSPVHKDQLAKLQMMARSAINPKTKEFDEAKLPAAYKKEYAELKEAVDTRKAGWDSALEDASRQRELAFSRLKGINPEAAATRTGTNTAPASSGEAVAGDFPTPTAKHIQALKNNPNAKAEFDGKFGPGAAAEYLGK